VAAFVSGFAPSPTGINTRYFQPSVVEITEATITAGGLLFEACLFLFIPLAVIHNNNKAGKQYKAYPELFAGLTPSF